MAKVMTLFVSLFVVFGLVFVTLPQALQTQAASAPNIISYQGRVLNANGVPVADASLDMVFSLYDAVSGGSCVWSNSSATCASQTTKAITVTDGLFSEDLGDTGASYAAITDDIFGNNASLFLEVRIEGETLTPRKQITAAPYALNADTVDGIDSTGFLSATGDTGTGDYDFTGAILLGASPLVFEGSSDDVNQTTFAITNPTGANTITVPNASGTIALTSDVSLTGAYAGGQTMTVDGTGDAIIDLTTTSDFLIKDNGANFFQFKDDATIQIDPTTTSGTALNFVASTVTTGKVIALSGTGLTSGRAIEIVVDNSLDNSSGAAIHLDYEPGSGNEEVDLIFAIESDCIGDASCSSFSDNNSVFTINSTGEVHSDTAFEVGTTRYQETSLNGSGAFTIASGGSSNLTLQSAGSSIILDDSDDLIVGSSTVTSAPFGVDESLNTIYIGEGSGTSAAVIFKASDADTGTLDYSTSDQWEFVGGHVDIFQALAVGANATASATTTLTVARDIASGFGTEIMALYGSSATAPGTSLFGQQVNISNASPTGTTTTLKGIVTNVDTNHATATTTSAFGGDFNTTVTAGTLTTGIGVMASATGATTNYAGYFHSAQTFFDDDSTPDATSVISGGAGDVYINDQLEVAGSSTTTGVVAAIGSDTLTTGIGLSISRPTSGTVFSNTTSGLVSIAVSDLSASGHLLHMDQNGTGTSIFVDQDGSSGTTLSGADGGAVHIANTNNANSAFTIYTNEGATAASGLAHWKIDNTAFDQDMLILENDSTDGGSSALFINGGGGAPAIDVDTDVADFAVSIFNDGNNDSRQGIDITACADSSPTGACDFIAFNDGNGTKLGAIEANGSAVTNASAGSDYAELFDGVHADFGAGDVIGLAVDGTVTLASDGTKVIGTYSVAPNTLGNWKEDWQTTGVYVPVALLGQVPVNVSMEGGAIQPGDYLTLSSTAGVAMKATGPAFMLGQALESASSNGQIMVFVEPKWHALDSIQNDDGVLITETLALANLGAATASAVFNSQEFELRGSAWNGTQAVERSMTLFNDVTTTDAYRLSVANNDGDEVAFVNQAGDLAIAGKLYPSDRGTLQTDKYIYYDGSAGPSGNFMRTNAAGWATGSYDFAEMFPSLDTLVSGEVVIFASDDEHVARSTSKTYDQRIAGIVSTQPGFLAGENLAGHVPIALAGRVPTFVTNENGPIAVGDPLTTSSLAGYAMKATAPGQIVGYAMESMTGESGSIIVFVRPSYYDGAPVDELPGVENEASGLAGSISDFSTTNRLDLAAGAITNISALIGMGERWSINEAGDFVTGGRITHLIESYQGEQVETYVPVARETTVQLSGTVQLLNGMASVDFEKIDPAFNDIISNEHSYRVFLTASAPTNPLYAMNREQDGFRIREVNGQSNATIDWMVIAYHKDYAPIDTLPEDGAIEDVFDPDTTEESPAGEGSGPTDESEQAEEEQTNPEEPEEEPVVEDETPVEDPIEEVIVVEEEVLDTSESEDSGTVSVEETADDPVIEETATEDTTIEETVNESAEEEEVPSTPEPEEAVPTEGVTTEEEA